MAPSYRMIARYKDQTVAHLLSTDLPQEFAAYTIFLIFICYVAYLPRHALVG